MKMSKKEQEKDFFDAVSRLMGSMAEGNAIPMTHIIRMAIESPARSFYVNRDYALRMVHQRRRQNLAGKTSTRKSKWTELDNALRRRRRIAPHESELEALDWVLLNHQPPRFYISEAYARKIFYTRSSSQS